MYSDACIYTWKAEVDTGGGVFLNDFLTFFLCLFGWFAMTSPTETGAPQFNWSMRPREIFTPNSSGITGGDHCVQVFFHGF